MLPKFHTEIFQQGCLIFNFVTVFFPPIFSEVQLRKKNYPKVNSHTNLNYSSAEKYHIFHYKLWKNISNTYPFKSALSRTKRTRNTSSSHGYEVNDGGKKSTLFYSIWDLVTNLVTSHYRRIKEHLGFAVDKIGQNLHSENVLF